MTSLFTYTGPAEGTQHDEIDIEFLGNDTTKMQVNYYVNGVGGHEAIINLGFDAAASAHEYAFHPGRQLVVASQAGPTDTLDRRSPRNTGETLRQAS